jgi:hypothetical protein
VSAPVFESVDDYTSDLLDLVATEQTPPVDREWQHYVDSLATVASRHAGLIPPNELRPLVRGEIAPKRIGALTHRALSQGLVRRTGDWQVSDDVEGRNGGKPAPVMEWIGESA